MSDVKPTRPSTSGQFRGGGGRGGGVRVAAMGRSGEVKKVLACVRVNVNTVL